MVVKIRNNMIRYLTTKILFVLPLKKDFGTVSDIDFTCQLNIHCEYDANEKCFQIFNCILFVCIIKMIQVKCLFF